MPTIQIAARISIKEWSVLLDVDTEIGKSLEPVDLFVSKQLAQTDGHLVWRIDEVIIGDSLVIAWVISFLPHLA